MLAFLAGFGGFVISTFQGLPPPPLPVRSAVMDFLWQHYRAGAAIQALVALFVVFCACMFLRRHSWARVAIQMFSVLLLVWTVMFSVFWLRVMAFMAPGPDHQPFFVVVRVIMSVAGVLGA